MLLITYVQRSIFNMQERHQPYLNLVDNVKHRTTLGHLRFEEALGGDTTVNFESNVLPEFKTSRSILQAAYDGKETEIGVFYKSTDEDTRVLLKEAIIDADQLIEAAAQLQGIKSIEAATTSTTEPVGEIVSLDSGTISSDTAIAVSDAIVPETPIFTEEGEKVRLNAAFDKAFDDFQTSLNNLSVHIRKMVNTDIDFLNTISWLSVVLVAAVFILSCVLLYRLQHGNDTLTSETQARLGDQAGIAGQLSDFVEAVSSGNFGVELNLSSEVGGLKDKLVTMRNTLKNNAEDERKRGWSTMGIAQVGDILRASTTNSTELYDNVTKFLVKYTKSNQGGLFVVNEDDHNNNSLELMACYAFERKKFLSKTIEPGVGLVGQCFLEGERILLTDVPEEYVSISSGLGGAKPKSILLVPMKLHERIYGVIELATFTQYEDYEVELVEKLAESIASAISTVRTNESTRILLEKTQQQTEEMKAQEEEIRQNMEELEATQEEMQRKQQALESELAQFQDQAQTLKVQEARLTQSQHALQGIIDNIPKAVFWKDRDLRFRGCNKIFARVAGVLSMTEILGKTDFDMPWSEQAEAYRADDYDVIRNKRPKLNIEERHKNSDGSESWVLTSKVPITDEKGDVVAILGMFEDITERKQKEADVATKLQEREHALKEIADLKRLLESKG